MNSTSSPKGSRERALPGRSKERSRRVPSGVPSDRQRPSTVAYTRAPFQTSMSDREPGGGEVPIVRVPPLVPSLTQICPSPKKTIRPPTTRASSQVSRQSELEQRSKAGTVPSGVPSLHHRAEYQAAPGPANASRPSISPMGRTG